MSESLYRKYRPQIFEDVVGQEHIERTLKNAIASDKVSHAYLFTGPRGTGKTTTARLLAKALLCTKGPTPDPDGTCEDCELVARGEHPDVYELDAASRTGVENVREEIIGRVGYAPTRGRYKVYIIDEVHMLSVAAFNALLKTLEEPPSHVVFILCTTDPQKVPETIHSRCQRFDFRRISAEELISRLGYICGMENITFEPEALDLIAHRAQGGMRDALTSLEQLIAFSEGSLTTEQAERLLGSIDSSDMAEIVQAIGKRDAAHCFRWTRQYMETGADLAQFTQDLAEHIRDMYVLSLSGADIALDLTEAARRELESELALFGSDRLARMLSVLGDLIADLRTSSNQRLSFEIALTRLIRPDSDLTLESLAERVECLERIGVTAGAGAATHAGTPAQGLDAAAGSATYAATATATMAQGATESASTSSQEVGSTYPSGKGGSAITPDATGAHAETLSPQYTEPTVASDHAGGEQREVNTAAPSDASGIPTSSAAADAGAVHGAHATSPAGAFATLTEANLSQAWNTVLAQLKKIGIQYSVLFMNAKPTLSEDASTVIVNFDTQNEFGYAQAQSAKVKETLRQAFNNAGLSHVLIQIGRGDLGGNSIARNAAEASRLAHEEQQAHQAAQAQQMQQPQQAQQPQQVPETSEPAAPAQAAAPVQVAAPTPSGPIWEETPSDAPLSGEIEDPGWVPDDVPADYEAPSEGESEDLNTTLSSVFGEGIVFEEVDE